MDINELRVICSPHYEGTDNFRMICQAWAQECMPLNLHWLNT